MWTGALLSWVALFAASYASSVTQLVGLQGALYALGGGRLLRSLHLHLLITCDHAIFYL